jgi:hypothetical protein
MSDDAGEVVAQIGPAHPLYSTLAKLDRADEQEKELRKDIAAALRAFHANATAKYLDVKAQEVVWVFQPPVAPVMWAVRVGEIVHDMRSALDHAVARICENDGVVRDRQHAFPICADYDTFVRRGIGTKAALGQLHDLKPQSIAAIEKLQPYHARKEAPKSAALYVLHELWNIDKHSMVNVCYTTGTLAVCKLLTPHHDGIHLRQPGPLEDRAVIARVPIRHLSKVQVETSIGIGVALNKAGDAVILQPELGRFLNELITATHDTIIALIDLFDAGLPPLGLKPSAEHQRRHPRTTW